jgi:hypothetical protein
MRAAAALMTMDLYMDRSSCSQRSPGAAVLTNATINGKVPAFRRRLYRLKQALVDIDDF